MESPKSTSLSEVVDAMRKDQCYSQQDCNCHENGIHKKRKKCESFLGFFYIFLTSLFFSLISVIFKKLWYISPGEMSFVHSAGMFTGALPVAVYCVRDVLGEKNSRGLLLLRGLSGSFATVCIAMSYMYLPLTEATTIISAFPVVTTVIARIFLKEECGIVQSILLVLTVCGVLLCVRLPELLGSRGNVSMDYAYIIGLAAAIGSIFLQSTTVVILRIIKHVHFSISLLYFGAVGMIANASITFAFDSAGFVAPICGWDQIFVLLLGIFSCLGNLANTKAVQVEAAGIVSALRTMEIVMAMILQVVFFGDALDVYNVCGGCLVIFSLSMMGVRKWMVMLPKESHIRKRLKYLLF